ncbi:Ig-like domain-containing protein, partial [Alteromonas sp. 14N.309.X.WAT.G.H12]|uniref:Ig-like domain-containing protein n=1 Tax=Alteromonas sp. 14N.309.X.WAT.G.H12 TaxID=3120824 RepID=UPI002FD47D40
ESVAISVTDADDETQTFAATVQPDGTYSADVPTALAEGDYTVSVTASDDAGNTTTVNENGSVDTSAPTLTVTDPGLGNDATPTITGNTDLAAGELVAISVTDADNETQTFSATVLPDGSFSADVPNDLAEGDYAVAVTATDDAGNTITINEDGTVDTSAPTLTVTDPGLGNDATPTITGNTDLAAGELVAISVTDADDDTQSFTATVQPDGSYSADVPTALAEGDYTISVTATDEAGNTITINEGGTVDTSAPTLTITDPGLGNDATPTITGNTDLAAGELVTISVTDADNDTQTFTATVQADGSFSADVPTALAEGDYTVAVSATDDAGNSITANEDGSVDTTAPTLTVTDPGLGNDATPTIAGNT